MARKIFIACPNQNWVHRYAVEALLGMIAEHHTKYEFMFSFRADKPIDSNRNAIVKLFLESDCEYLIFLDADNPWIKDPIHLVELDKDVLGLPTPIHYSQISQKGMGHNPIMWNAFDKHPRDPGWREHHPQQGLQRCDAVGSGCVIIARRVLEVVKPAFKREWNEDGIQRVGSDLLFCSRAKAAGFEVWTHYDYPCHHFKEDDLAGFFQLLRQRDIEQANRANINTPEYWDGQWRTRGERKYPQYDLICDKVRELEEAQATPLEVLDFGCGRGDLLAKLDRIPGVCAEGIDHSPRAVEICRERQLVASVGTVPLSSPPAPWDLIICTEVLEHLDDDKGAIEEFFKHTNRVIYSVPNNCLPPGLEPEHRRVYTHKHVEAITPHLKEIRLVGDYLLVTAEKELVEGEKKEGAHGGSRQVQHVR